jgi:ribosome silencing factor RsfS/YbeB/iojap
VPGKKKSPPKPAPRTSKAARKRAASGPRSKPTRTASQAARAAPPATRPPAPPALELVIMTALEDMKALDIRIIDVRGLTDIADTMVIASGTSDRHVRSVAQRVVEKTKEAGYRPHGVEGQKDSDWVLIDLHDTIVHVMLPRVREFYGLEKLWDMTAAKRAVHA